MSALGRADITEVGTVCSDQTTKPRPVAAGRVLHFRADADQWASDDAVGDGGRALPDVNRVQLR